MPKYQAVQLPYNDRQTVATIILPKVRCFDAVGVCMKFPLPKAPHWPQQWWKCNPIGPWNLHSFVIMCITLWSATVWWLSSIYWFHMVSYSFFFYHLYNTMLLCVCWMIIPHVIWPTVVVSNLGVTNATVARFPEGGGTKSLRWTGGQPTLGSVPELISVWEGTSEYGINHPHIYIYTVYIYIYMYAETLQKSRKSR